jgi:serine/threonine protein kinase
MHIDPKTSGWILGKLLKLLAFVHEQGISIGDISGENILIERDQHYVAIFDWDKAAMYPEGKVPDSVASDEIIQLTKEVLRVLGGDIETGKLLPDSQLKDSQYENFLIRLILGVYSDAGEAHDDFYKLIRALWSREFWPFTAYSIE